MTLKTQKNMLNMRAVIGWYSRRALFLFFVIHERWSDKIHVRSYVMYDVGAGFWGKQESNVISSTCSRGLVFSQTYCSVVGSYSHFHLLSLTGVCRCSDIGMQNTEHIQSPLSPSLIPRCAMRGWMCEVHVWSLNLCLPKRSAGWGSTLWGMNHFFADVLAGKGVPLCCFDQRCELG